MGSDVRISTVAIAQGNLTIRVTETPQVSQPQPFSNTGTTTTVPRTQIQIDDSKGNKMAVLHDGVSLQSLVDGLERAGRRTARHHLDPAGDQGGRRAAGRHRGDRMNAAIDTSAAMTALRAATARRAAARPRSGSRRRRPRRHFEGVFITQFLGEMFDGISTDGPFGGGQGEEMFRSLMIDEYGKQIAAQGGFGLADAVTRELLKTQETVH